ncbi:YkgJ family cysteine cluster protein [Halochromatium roseum]|uniref:YkgJ family cysteine cluster protein n=1 Tax=Halochromatium roseum TaxID=391920 RepID=UPI0019128A01|nr:YkgJ family cysteine cluster protein [Halochromatium roseum]MBK5939042.1 zinc/iron-chelating domain-containing protein [Halochromatium roseum]
MVDSGEVVDPRVHCEDCQACCCRKEVLLLGDTRVPNHFVVLDAWGAEVMERLDDGWCIALDRQRLRCSIYSMRPQLCRDVAMGGAECLAARVECDLC